MKTMIFKSGATLKLTDKEGNNFLKYMINNSETTLHRGDLKGDRPCYIQFSEVVAIY